MQEKLQELVTKFNKSESKKKEKIKDLERVILISFEDDGNYYTVLRNGQLSDIEQGDDVKADIVVSTTTDTFLRILNKEEDALTAYFAKKIKIKAKLMDKLLIGEILR
ncbi:MAG: sterol carrier protein [Euryarchaeota archaeon]|nr:sterol carrier protein [Euryarchaeota archaeon]